MVESSVTGLFKTFFILIGAFVVLRFLGRLMIIKRTIDHQKVFQTEQNRLKKERQKSAKNYGKTTILGIYPKNKKEKSYDVEDVPFEEVK